MLYLLGALVVGFALGIASDFVILAVASVIVLALGVSGIGLQGRGFWAYPATAALGLVLLQLGFFIARLLHATREMRGAASPRRGAGTQAHEADPAANKRAESCRGD